MWSGQAFTRWWKKGKGLPFAEQLHTVCPIWPLQHSDRKGAIILLSHGALWKSKHLSSSKCWGYDSNPGVPTFKAWYVHFLLLPPSLSPVRHDWFWDWWTCSNTNRPFSFQIHLVVFINSPRSYPLELFVLPLETEGWETQSKKKE